MIKTIDASILDSLGSQAKGSPRKRSHHTLHTELSDPVQRLFIAMEPETYVRPHRHSDPETWEVLTIVRGSLVLNIFDDRGVVLEKTLLKAGGSVIAVEFPCNTWHAPASLEPGTVVFEVKQGPYKAIEEKNLAVWAPSEGDPTAENFLRWYRTANVGDRAPGRC